MLTREFVCVTQHRPLWALSTVNLCYMNSLMNLNLERASDSSDSAILALIMHKDLQRKNELLSSLPSGPKGKMIPVSCWLKISGDIQSRISIQRECLTTVLIATLRIFSVPLFSSNFQKFWKSVVYFGHRIAKYTKQFMGQWQPFSSLCVYMPSVPLEPVQCLWDVCLCAPGAKVMVAPFWYLIFFFIQNMCPQCGNSPMLLAL